MPLEPVFVVRPRAGALGCEGRVAGGASSQELVAGRAGKNSVGILGARGVGLDGVRDWEVNF